MGMFDDIKCKFPLPVAGANGLSYQTKDTPQQFLDLYEIRVDGTLWHQDYDIEDHSDAAIWTREHPGQKSPEGLSEFIGCMTRVNKRWEQQLTFTGEIVFYAMYSGGDGKLTNSHKRDGWLVWSAHFVSGKLIHLALSENRVPEQSANLA